MIINNRWTVLFGGVMVSFILLLIIPEDDIVRRSVSITLIAIFSICYYLYKCYYKKFSFQSDLVITLYTLFQFLVPVLYLAFYYSANPELDEFANYRFGYAITSFAALIGQAMFFLGYESIKPAIRFPRIQITEKSLSSFFLVLLPLLVLIWIGRAVLLATGSYYQVYRTDFQNISHHFSFFSQLSGYGLIIVGALFMVAFSEKQKRQRKIKFTAAIAIFMLEMLWHVPAGMREPIAYTILAVLFAYIVIKRMIPVKTIVVLAIISIPLLAIFNSYRYVASSYTGVSEINLKVTLPALLEAKDRLNINNEDMLASTIYRMNEGISLGYLLMNFSNDYEYEYGYTYWKIPSIVIPRFIYPDKPVLTTSLNEYYVLLVGSMPITFWGEAYVNFSWAGIIIMSYLLGIMMKGFDYVFIKRAHKPYWMYMYLFSSIHIMRLLSQAAVLWMSFLLKSILLAVILTAMHSVLIQMVKKPSKALMIRGNE